MRASDGRCFYHPMGSGIEEKLITTVVTRNYISSMVISAPTAVPVPGLGGTVIFAP